MSWRSDRMAVGLGVPMTEVNHGLGRWEAKNQAGHRRPVGLQHRVLVRPHLGASRRHQSPRPASTRYGLEGGRSALERATRRDAEIGLRPAVDGDRGIAQHRPAEEARLAAGTSRRCATRCSATRCGTWSPRRDPGRCSSIAGAPCSVPGKFFPRSIGATATESGTFAQAAERLPGDRRHGFRHRLPAAHSPDRTH